MKKGEIFYKIKECQEIEYRYKDSDIIGIDNRIPYGIGPIWWVIEKHKTDGRKYTTGGWISENLHTYKQKYSTLEEAKKVLKEKK